MSDVNDISEIPASPREVIGVAEAPAKMTARTELTVTQQKVVYEIFSNPRKALTAVSRADPTSPISSKTLKAIGCKIGPELAKHDITTELVAEKLDEFLNATKLDRNGDVVPDYLTQRWALQQVMLLGDLYPAKRLKLEKDDSDKKALFMDVSIEELEKIKGIISYVSNPSEKIGEVKQLEVQDDPQT